MKAVNITRYGGRMKYSEVPLPQLQHGQVLIKMAYAPVNPSDIYYSKGVYGIKKELPTVIGFEGSGQVVDAESSNKQDLIGKYVACWSHENINSGTWGEYLITNQNCIMNIKSEKKVKKFHSPMINPGTVMGFYNKLKQKDSEYVIINASFSQLGQMCVKYFKQKGIKPICLVRKQEQFEKLYELGAEKVFMQDDIDQIQEYVNNTNTKVFLDAVGGPPAANVFTIMPSKSTMLTYGAFELKKMELDSQLFVFQQKQIEGFWLPRYFKQLSIEERQEQFKEIYDNIKNGTFTTSVYKEYNIEDFQTAVFDSMQHGNKGKCLLKFD